MYGSNPKRNLLSLRIKTIHEDVSRVDGVLHMKNETDIFMVSILGRVSNIKQSGVDIDYEINDGTGIINAHLFGSEEKKNDIEMIKYEIYIYIYVYVIFVECISLNNNNNNNIEKIN